MQAHCRAHVARRGTAGAPKANDEGGRGGKGHHRGTIRELKGQHAKVSGRGSGSHSNPRQCL